MTLWRSSTVRRAILPEHHHRKVSYLDNLNCLQQHVLNAVLSLINAPHVTTPFAFAAISHRRNIHESPFCPVLYYLNIFIG